MSDSAVGFLGDPLRAFDPVECQNLALVLQADDTVNGRFPVIKVRVFLVPAKQFFHSGVSLSSASGKRITQLTFFLNGLSTKRAALHTVQQRLDQILQDFTHHEPVTDKDFCQQPGIIRLQPTAEPTLYNVEQTLAMHERRKVHWSQPPLIKEQPVHAEPPVTA
jgi:hypothetical protein